MRWMLLNAVVAASLLVSTSLASQDPPYRAGFWLAGGVGVGGAAWQCDGCADQSHGGWSWSLRMGGTPSKSVLLGAETNVAIHDVGAEEVRTGYLLAVTAYWYPSVARGLFLKGGVGQSALIQRTSTTLVESWGGAVLAGAGYDFRVGRKISITPMLSLWRSTRADLTTDSSTVQTGVRHSGATLDVGVTFHSLFKGKNPPPERPQTRRGFWLGIALGVANLAGHCDSCTSGDHGAASGVLRFGATLSKKTLLGVELLGTPRPGSYSRAPGDTTAPLVSASYIAATVYWYPAANGGVFLKSGAGLSTYSQPTDSIDAFNTAGAILIGAGYDIRIGNMTSITPMVTFWGSTKADLKDGSATVAAGFRHTGAAFQVGVTFH